MMALLVVLVLFHIMYVFVLVTFEFLSHHLFWKSCRLGLLTSLNVVTSFPWYIVGEVWDLIVIVSDRCPL